jgi:hypothetical protein
MHAEGSVLLEQDHAIAGAEPRNGAAVVGDLAAGDQDPHRATGYRLSITERAGRESLRSVVRERGPARCSG